MQDDLWREAMEFLSRQVGAPVVVGSKTFGERPFFQELRARKVPDEFEGEDGIKYVRLKEEGVPIVVGPFQTDELFKGDDELAQEYKKLPRASSAVDATIRGVVSLAVKSGKQNATLHLQLRRANLLLEFSKEMGRVQSVQDALQTAVQFIVHKFKLSNAVVQVDSLQASQFDVSSAQKEVGSRLISQLKQSKLPVVVKNAQDDFMLEGVEGLEEAGSFVAAFPIVHDRNFLGAAVFFAEEERVLDHVGELLSELLGILLRLSKLEHVEKSARTDALTGLPNRVEIAQRMGKIMGDHASKGAPVSVIMADVDNFKKFNDTHGHPEGDKLLKRVAEVVKSATPKEGLSCRYGGEEFMLVLPGFDQNAASEVAERFRQGVEQRCQSTISVGVMSCLNSSASFETLVKEADRALYRAKHLGKNKVVSFVMVDKTLGVIDQ